MNYCTLGEIKEELGVESSEHDNILQAMIGQVKEIIDNYCNRSFDTVEETRYFDGAGSMLFIDDLLPTDDITISLDLDGDGEYEVTMDDSDYVLCPLNKTPKTWIATRSRGTYSSFAKGIRAGVEIEGTWGYDATVPESIRRAAIMITSRLWKRKATAYASVVASTELGPFEVFRGLDADIVMILSPYRKMNI